MNVLTVNLEKKLIKENKKLFTPQELLVVKEYEKVANIEEEQGKILERVGLMENARNGCRIKELSRLRNESLKKYPAEKVFHISQIEAICKKYHLRFLATEYYKGTIDMGLATKISNFEVAYGNHCLKNNTYIIAPAESFKLEEKPKDPLFFYAITSEYYYLIHKWGNDLSIFRRFLALFEKRRNCFLFNFFILVFAIFCVSVLPCVATILFIILAGTLNICSWIFMGVEERGYVKRNTNWNNHYRE